MIIKEYYVIPENDTDERFVTEEMSFLIDVSVKNRDKFETVEDYQNSIKNRYNNWLFKSVSYG